jgi:hypothetical protein
MVQQVLDLLNVVVTQSCEICAFGQELPDNAVGVFIGAALPRAVRLCEVDGPTGSLGESLVLGELLSVVER